MLDIGAAIRQPRLAILFAAALLLTACDTGAPSTGAASSSAPSGSAGAAGISLQGTPPSNAAVGSAYSFKPTASVTGTGVTFSIQGAAGWMSFNATTGAVSGTPTASDQGQTPSITISVSDGAKSASIGPFTVTVEPPGAVGSAALSWTPPTNNEDGTPIAGLTGYHIYYSTDPSSFDNAVDVAGASSTTYTVSGLAPGTYYFAVAAYNSDGVESSMSNIGNKTI